MPDETRRDFLKAIALGAAFAAVGGAVTYYGTTEQRTIYTTITSIIQPKKTETQPQQQQPAETKPKPKMAVRPVGPCRFCGTGCGVQATVIEDPETGLAKDIVALSGIPTYPVNRGALCTKAFYIHKAIGHGGNKQAYEERLKKPLVIKDWIIPGKNRPPITPEEIPQAPRVARRQVSKNYNAKLPTVEHIRQNYVEVDWDTAVKFFTAILKYAIQKYGVHAFAYYGSGQLGTEESYVINKLTKAGLHTNNLDGNPRMCMVSAVGGFITSFGADEPEVSYDHIDIPEPDTKTHAETFLLIGTNTAEAHPIVFGRIAKVKQANPDKVKIILADPRKTRSGSIADLWLPLRWSMDVAFLHTLAHIVAFRLDNCKVDTQNWKVTCDGKYVDITWLKRHADFAIPKETAKTWALKDYNTKYNNLGDLNKVWDMGTTASIESNYTLYPSVGKEYKSEDEVEKDWWKGFALYLKFLEMFKPEVMVKILFGDEKPLINKETAKKLIQEGKLKPEEVGDLNTQEPFVEIDPVKAMELAAEWMASQRLLVLWTMGINQKIQGVHAVNGIINFLALTGQLGKWGAGALSLTGQPNACGGIRDQGGLAHVLPYGRLIALKAAREEVENIWKKLTEDYLKERGLPADQIKAEVDKVKIHPVPGPHVVEMFRRVSAGQLKVVWIAETNPGQSLPNVYKFRAGMAKPHDDDPAFPFIVVSDIYPTRTTDLADLVLPAAAWGEKEFKYGCTERRYSVARYTILPPGEAVGDHMIFAMLGTAWENDPDLSKIVPKGIVSGFWPEDVVKKAGDKWIQYVVEKSRDKKWHEEFLNRLWDRDILSLAKNTYYDFSYVKREMFRKMINGFRWPWPEQYATVPSVKERYDKYESATRYAYPYDPLLPDPDTLKKIYEDIKNINDPAKLEEYVKKLPENDPKMYVHHVHKKKWLGKLSHNPVLMRWVLKQIIEEIDDVEYKRKSRVPDNWYVVFYAKPTGRMTVWARPWLPVKMDHETGKVEINKEVIITYEKLDADEVFKGKISVFSEPKGPFKVVEKHTAVPASGDPLKGLQVLEQKSWGEALKTNFGDIEAIFEIALAPAEAPGFSLKYKLDNGQELVIRDAKEYPIVATTGRVIEHWHTGTMTGRVPELRRVKPEAYVEIHKDVADQLGVKDGDWVTVESPRGKVTLKAVVLNPKTGLGGPRKDYVFIPWFDENKLANALTLDNYDVQPYFFQPDYKTCAARLRKARPDEIPTQPKQQTSAPKYNIDVVK
ncbi:MAG: molybdopterin oxidoreductase family protein [Crenarchaeota archaeon]|nr:molybdopterin oxidoreductase family protein [Thermoproteota archaeon]